MKHPEEFGFVMQATVLIVGVLNCSFGVFGWYLFGSGIEDVITKSLKTDDTTPGIIAQLFLAVYILCTYPIVMFPIPEIIDHYNKTNK